MNKLTHSEKKPGLLTILVKSIGNTNINTLAKNYCRYQYRYCCRKVLTIPILLQAILFLLIQQSQVHLRRGPAGCASFFLCRCGSQLQLQCVKILHATYFPSHVNKNPPPMWKGLYRTKTANSKVILFFHSLRLL